MALTTGIALGGCALETDDVAFKSGAGDGTMDNLKESKNDNGAAATFSTQGAIDLTGEYFQAQGTNGRSCATCHDAHEVWGVLPSSIARRFEETGGTDPIFNPLDAKNPTTNDFLTVEGRRHAYENMINFGVFRRGGTPRADRQWDIVAVDDPNGYAGTNRLVQWRRSMPTINFPLGTTRINWDGGNQQAGSTPTIRGGLERQAAGNISGGQQGPNPAPADIVKDIVDFEISLFTAQTRVHGIGNLVENGATAGPEQLASQAREAGRFDLFDAWIGDENEARAQIARGQELFNNPNPGGRSCNGCHNSRNNGTNINNLMFDVGVASEAHRQPWQALHTFKNRITGEERKLTDAGFGQVTGNWTDLGRFKTPTIRALAGRAPYFHDGTAPDLEAVVIHYEEFLGFVFTDQERADLVAFLGAL